MTVDIEEYLNQIEHLVADARSVPLSSLVMVNRGELDGLLEDLRAHLPEELRQSRWVVKERDDVLAAAAREAEQVRSDARREAERLVDSEEIVREAHREAERIVEEAREQARVLRFEAEDYADAKLASFEAVLERTLRTVGRGRERLRGRLGDEPVVQPDPEDATQFFDQDRP